MSLPGRGADHAPFQQSFLIRLLLFPLGIVYRLWTASIRIKFPDKNGRSVLKSENGSAIFILWHNRLFLAGEWHRRFRKKHVCYGLISGSRDGAWLETFYGWAGIQAIRGSQNRRGTQAARDLIRVLKDGHDVGITPDGSRGPKYEAKPGALLVAKASGSPVALLSFSYSRAIRLKSWDQFVIPWPFSIVRAQTRILSQEELFAGRDLKQATLYMQQKLMEMTEDYE